MKAKIINLTQHKATPEQKAAGVIDWADAYAVVRKDVEDSGGDVVDFSFKVPRDVGYILTFDNVEEAQNQRHQRAHTLANMVEMLGFKKAMIGGAPFFMGPLEQALRDRGIAPLYAFSERIVEEEVQEDGSVKKRSVFKHKGFVGCTMSAYDAGYRDGWDDACK